MLVYLNGQFLPAEEAKVSVFDHGYLYGDGVFEGIRAYKGKIFRLRRHIDRLWDSAKAIRLTMPMSKEDLEDACREAIKVNDLDDAYLRVVVSRGAGDLGLSPFNCKEPTVVVIAGKISLYPKEMYEKGMAIVTAATPRNHPEALNPKIKSLNYLNNILAKIEALDRGVMEALMFNHQGYVAEATGDNIFLVRKGVLITPPESAGVLLGITRECVMELAKKLGITVEERDINRYDIYVADECFLTGTAAEIISITSVDGRTIGDGTPGPVTNKLLDSFRALVGNEDENA